MLQLDKINFRGHIRDGKLKLKDERYFRFHISKYQDCPVTIRIERIKSSKSNKQLGLYWGGYLEQMSLTTGHTPEELHLILKEKYAPRKIIKWRGRDIAVQKGMKEFSVGEMQEFIFNTEKEAAELNIVLKDYDPAPLLNP